MWRLQFTRGVIVTKELNERADSLDQDKERQIAYAGYLKRHAIRGTHDAQSRASVCLFLRSGG